VAFLPGSHQEDELARSFMVIEVKTVELTRTQLSSAIVAVQEYIKLLQKESAENPQGGEHEDILIAESVLRKLASAQSGK
jgi:hypothetical protein